MKNGKQTPRKKNVRFKFNFSWKNILLYSFLGFFLLFILIGINQPFQETKTVPISSVIKDVQNDQVKEISVTDTKLAVTEKNGKQVQSFKESGSNIYQIFNDAGISKKELDKTNIIINDNSSLNNWVNILSSVLPVVLMVAFFYFLFRQARGAQESIFSFGQSKAKLFGKDTPKISFNDVAGVDEAKQELTEIVDFLKNPGKYKAMGAHTPKGVLMVGPSGTGKTLLARATAGEAGVPFFSMAGSEFMEMLVGVGASRVRDLFNTAKKSQPAIIFIDEIDAIGRQRGVGLMGGHDEREQTLNQILVEMDGFSPTEQLVVIAATNRPDVLDPALVRPGRFDRRVVLDLPDVDGRKAILLIHAKGKPFDNVNWEKIAKRTVGFSGADLENMLNEAAILAARLNKKAIDMSDLEEAATKVKLGPEKRRLQSDMDRKMTAYHEAGHALVSWQMPHMDPVHRISIVSRGLSLGHTMMEPTERVHETKTHLLEQIAVMLGGRAAESLVFNEMTTGASDDIAKATEVARTMVVEYGMSSLGPVNLDGEKQHPFYEQINLSPDMASKVDMEIKRITDNAYKIAVDILKKLTKKLDLLAGELMTKETIEAEEFQRLIGPKIISDKSNLALAGIKT